MAEAPLDDPTESNFRTALSSFFLRMLEEGAADHGAIEALIEVRREGQGNAARAHAAAMVLAAAIQNDTVWDAMQQARQLVVYGRAETKKHETHPR